MSLPKAVLLDRDGVICKEQSYITNVRDFYLLPQVGEAISLLNKNNIKVAVVTNQSAIARGLLTEEGLALIHQNMCDELELVNAKVDALYYSPYLPEKIQGGVSKHQIEHRDRKPNIGMLEKACAHFDIDLTEAIMIGDSAKDLEAAENANMPFLGVKSNKANEIQGKCQVFDGLYEAVRQIIKL